MPRLIIRYTLLQLPGYVLLILVLILLRRIVNIPDTTLWAVLGLWLAKDIVLFPLVGRYYAPENFQDRFSMIGKDGIVQKPLAPAGTIRVRGELWKAEVTEQWHSIEYGRRVVVQDIKGLTLKVKPAENSEKPSKTP